MKVVRWNEIVNIRKRVGSGQMQNIMKSIPMFLATIANIT